MKGSIFHIKFGCICGSWERKDSRTEKIWFSKDCTRKQRVRWKFLCLFNIVSINLSKKNRKPFSFLSYPFTPFLGGLLLNWRVCLCLNLGGPLRGVVGPWFEVGGANTVLSLILLVFGWLMVFFQALWTVRERERKIIQWSVGHRGQALLFKLKIGMRKQYEKSLKWLIYLFV